VQVSNCVEALIFLALAPFVKPFTNTFFPGIDNMLVHVNEQTLDLAIKAIEGESDFILILMKRITHA